jgi:SAM-dependent methyltransferase
MGIVGTFDVENYGDLLFPLLAREAVARRGEAIAVEPFSPVARGADAWPYAVRSTLELPERLPGMRALLVGGGQIIRFDGGYPVPVDPRVQLPVDYWLTPAAEAAFVGIPVIWNAVGAWTGSPAAPWADALVAATLSASHFVGLRDEASREHLRPRAGTATLELLPDTAFSISRFWPLAAETVAFARWRATVGLAGRFAVVQADAGLAPQWESIESLLAGLGFDAVVLLPVCRCHGDAVARLPPARRLRCIPSEWPAPRLLAEIIGRASWVVASSLHACITAASYGVPVVRVPSFNAADRKFALLEGLAGVADIDRPEAVARLVARGLVGDPLLDSWADLLDAHWDRVVAVVRDPALHDAGRSQAIMLRWFSGAVRAAERANLSPATVPAQPPERPPALAAPPAPVIPLAEDLGPLRIRVERGAGADDPATVFEIAPAEFETFAFADGDRLRVLPEAVAAALPVTWGDRHVEIAPGRAIRVPSEYRSFEFRGFRIPVHLIALTGAGPETLDSIGRAHIRNFDRHVGLFPGMTLVDLGCGIGRDAFQLLDFLDAQGRYVGVDVTRDSMLWCQRNITARDARFCFHHFDAFNELYNPFGRRHTEDFQLPLADASVDRITLASVFTHLLEDEVVHYMREFRRVLRPDGLVYANFFLHAPEALAAARTTGTTPWTARFEHRLGDGVYGNDPTYPRGAVAYSDAAMRRMMARAGLVTDRPYVKGSWSGLYGDQAEDGQDAVILRVG